MLQYCKEEVGVVPDSEGFLNTEVMFDGTWMTRRHSSLVGVETVAEAYTGFFLDGHVYSKYCHACSFWERKIKEDKALLGKFLKWKENYVRRILVRDQGKWQQLLQYYCGQGQKR